MKLSKFGQEIESKGINIIFEPLEEHIQPKDSFEFQEDIDYVINEYNSGNFSAWFCASVKLEFKGIESETEYLGGCSYKSFDEFTSLDNDYFDDMLKTCLNNLKEKIETIKNLEITF